MRKQQGEQHPEPAGAGTPETMFEAEAERVAVSRGAEGGESAVIVATVEAALLEGRALPDECEKEHGDGRKTGFGGG